MADQSPMPPGTTLPYFSLNDVVSGKTVSADDFPDRPLVVMFICRHCPYVKHVQDELAKLGKDYEGKIGIVAISSNDTEAYPEDSPDSLKEQAGQVGFNFPYLYDESQAVARKYTAACTPDTFLLDSQKKLAYRGQLDESRPGSNIPVTGVDLRAAIDALLSGQKVNQDQKPSVGCSIKWKA